MTAIESPHYQAARDQIRGNPLIAQLAAGIATVPLASLAHDDGTPRFAFMQQANHAFDQAQAHNAANPRYQPYPPGAPRHLGLIAEALLAERAATRAAVAAALAAPRIDPESVEVTQIIERLRAGESPLAIASQEGAPTATAPGPAAGENTKEETR
jgi:hypothetical protein